MSNLYVAPDYMVVGYVVGDITTTTTDIFSSVISYNTVENPLNTTYSFNITSQNTGLPVELDSLTEITLTDGKKFTIPAGSTTYSIDIPKTSMISRIDFETTPSMSNVNSTSVNVGTKTIELVETVVGDIKQRTIKVTDGELVSTLPESARIALTTGEVLYLSDLSRTATVKAKTTVTSGISKIYTVDATSGPTTIMSTTSATDAFKILNASSSPSLPAKTIYHSTKGVETVEQMGLNIGSLVFDTAVSLTGKVYYKIDEDVLTVNRLKSFKNVRELFNLKDLRN